VEWQAPDPTALSPQDTITRRARLPRVIFVRDAG